VPITRAQVPASVQESVEFRSACPASAEVLRRVFGGRKPVEPPTISDWRGIPRR